MSARTAGAFVVAAALAGTSLPVRAANPARVTQVIREVKLLPNEASPRPAAVNDLVKEDTAVRTGDQSKSELTFPDLTITRLGANTIYNYNRAGRSVELGGGSILLRVPKNSGGGSVHTSAVSVAVTGTTFILESGRGGRSKLYMLEGSSRMSLRKVSGQSRDVLAGQMLDVPAGAKKLPMPVNFDVNDLMRKHPLIVGFPPLPSSDDIARTAQAPTAPVINVSGLGLPPIVFGGSGGSSGGGTRRPPYPNGNPPTTGGKGDTQTQTGERGPRKPPRNPKRPPGTG